LSEAKSKRGSVMAPLLTANPRQENSDAAAMSNKA
jgi:hypothetical protein